MIACGERDSEICETGKVLGYTKSPHFSVSKRRESSLNDIMILYFDMPKLLQIKI